MKKSNDASKILARAVKRYGAAEVARRLGIPERSVQNWSSGARSPTGAARSLILAVYGTTTQATPRPTAPAKKTPAPVPATDDDDDEPAELAPVAETSSKSRLLEMVIFLREEMLTKKSDLSSRELAALASAYTSAERQYARVAGEFQLTESMIVRSAPFARAMAIVRSVLEKYPGAAKELEDAIEQLGGGV